MKHYYRIRIARPGRDAIYLFPSNKDVLDFSKQNYPRIPNGDVMLSEISRESYEQTLARLGKSRKEYEQTLARLKMRSLNESYTSMLEFAVKS